MGMQRVASAHLAAVVPPALIEALLGDAMAGAFGGDPQAASDLARELSSICSSTESLQATFDAFDGATGSDPIERALDEFFAESSDSRAAVIGLLERAAGLLRALAEGTDAVDVALHNSLAVEDGRSVIRVSTMDAPQVRMGGPR